MDHSKSYIIIKSYLWEINTVLPEDVLNACPLTEKSVDHRRTRWDHGGLEKVAQQRQNRVEPLKFTLLGLNQNPLSELCQNNEVQNDRGSEQRVLTCVVQDNRVLSPHKDFRRVFVHGTLAVANVGDVLDHNLIGGKGRKRGRGWKVMNMKTEGRGRGRGIGQPCIHLQCDQVSPWDHTRFGWIPPYHPPHCAWRSARQEKQTKNEREEKLKWLNTHNSYSAEPHLFGSKLFGCRQIFPIVVSEMVIADNRHRLDGDTSSSQYHHHHHHHHHYRTLIPADTKKSAITDFTLVWPDLKSSPARNTFFCSASSITPGTNVFWGDPLM